MSALMTKFGLDRLSPDERRQLADELLDSVADAPLSEAMKDYLDRRLEAIKGDPLAGSPYEEVLARLRGKR